MNNRDIRIWSVAYTGMAVAVIGMGLVAAGIALLYGARTYWSSGAEGAFAVSFVLCVIGGFATLAATAALTWSGDRVHGRDRRWLQGGAIALLIVLGVCALVALSLGETVYLNTWNNGD